MGPFAAAGRDRVRDAATTGRPRRDSRGPDSLAPPTARRRGCAPSRRARSCRERPRAPPPAARRAAAAAAGPRLAAASVVGGAAAAGSAANDGVATVADERRAETLLRSGAPCATTSRRAPPARSPLRERHRVERALDAERLERRHLLGLHQPGTATSLCGLWSAPRSIRNANLPGCAPSCCGSSPATRPRRPRFVALVSSRSTSGWCPEAPKAALPPEARLALQSQPDFDIQN